MRKHISLLFSILFFPYLIYWSTIFALLLSPQSLLRSGVTQQALPPVPCIFIARRFQFSFFHRRLARVCLIVCLPTLLMMGAFTSRSFFFLQINSKSHHGGVRTHGPTLLQQQQYSQHSRVTTINRPHGGDRQLTPREEVLHTWQTTSYLVLCYTWYLVSVTKVHNNRFTCKIYQPDLQHAGPMGYGFSWRVKLLAHSAGLRAVGIYRILLCSPLEAGYPCLLQVQIWKFGGAWRSILSIWQKNRSCLPVLSLVTQVVEELRTTNRFASLLVVHNKHTSSSLDVYIVTNQTPASNIIYTCYLLHIDRSGRHGGTGDSGTPDDALRVRTEQLFGSKSSSWRALLFRGNLLTRPESRAGAGVLKNTRNFCTKYFLPDFFAVFIWYPPSHPFCYLLPAYYLVL